MTGACQTINTRADGHLEITPAASTRGTQQPQLHPLVRPTSTTCPTTSTAFPLELVPTSTPCPTSTTASPASPLHHLHHPCLWPLTQWDLRRCVYGWFEAMRLDRPRPRHGGMQATGPGGLGGLCQVDIESQRHSWAVGGLRGQEPPA